MEKRTASIFALVLPALLWSSTAARADIPQAEENPSAQPESELLLTNTADLVGLFLEGYNYPIGSWVGAPTVFQPMTIVWADTTNLPSGLAGITNFVPTSLEGVNAWPLWITLWPQSNTVTVLQPWSGESLTEFSVPDGFSPWQIYDKSLYPSCILFGINYTNLETLVEEGYTQFSVPMVVTHAWLMDVNSRDAYWNNLEADCEAAEATTASAASMMGSRFMTMDEDDDGGDPCFITNPAAPFFVTGITQATNGTLVTWQSCPNMIYWIASAQALTTNTYWVRQAPTMFGQNGTTSWQDTTTTNGSNVTSNFYRVGRRLPILIAAGDAHSLVVSTNGALWGFGADGGGQLGDGTTGQGFESDQPWPQQMLNPTNCYAGTITNAQALAAGSGFSVAADFNGVAWSWGGDGFTAGNDMPPSRVSTVSNVVSLACGVEHTLALRGDGAVFAWGANSMGQLGVTDGTVFTTNAMQSVGLTNIIAVAAGYDHSVALQNNGNVWVFGDNGSGQFGNNGTVSTNVPILVTTISNVIAIAAGGYHTLAILSNQTLWTFGDNDQGQLGHDGNNLLPGQVPGLSNVVAIAGGYAFSMAVTSNGNIYAWGDNTYSELGTNSSALASTNRPILVRTLSNAVMVAASPAAYYGDHSLAVTVNQGVYQYWGWGLNYTGEAGNGQDRTNQDTPALVQLTNKCVQCVQLGTSGIFTAQCTGTLTLFFNDNAFGDNGTLSYSVTVSNLVSMSLLVQTNVPGIAQNGVTVGPVTNGLAYSYTASGFCSYDGSSEDEVDPNGNDHLGLPRGCPYTGQSSCGFVCPDTICYSLVGRITQ